MKKLFSLLILASLMFAVSTNVEAQTKRTTTRKTTTTAKRTTPVKKTTTTAAKPKPQMVDMGLSVKWSNIDLGAASTKAAGGLYFASEDVAKACGEGWRLPSSAEFNELIENCDKVILEQNGVPSCVEFTSKLNGAKLYFYFPKTYCKDTSSSKVGSNPDNGAYYIPYHLTNGLVKNFVVGNFKRVNPSGYQQLKSLLTQIGMEKVKFTEWPNDVLQAVQYEQQSKQGALFSYYWDWMGGVRESAINATKKVLIRPVYSINDDDDEE